MAIGPEVEFKKPSLTLSPSTHVPVDPVPAAVLPLLDESSPQLTASIDSASAEPTTKRDRRLLFLIIRVLLRGVGRRT
jgi:hypothetical protein